MARPALKVEIGFGATWQTASPTWTDVTGWLLDSGVTWSSGRGRDSDSIQAGTARVTLRNSDDRFTPTWTGGPYGSNVVPLVPIRITATWQLSTYGLWRGFVREWQPNWDDPGNAAVTLDCVDGLRVFAQTNVRSSYFVKMLSKSPSYYWSMQDRIQWSSQVDDLTGNGNYAIGAGAEAGSGAGVRYGALSACDLEDNPNGLAVYTGTTGGRISGTSDFTIGFWWNGDGRDMSGGAGDYRKFFQQSASGTNFIYITYHSSSSKVVCEIYSGGTLQTLVSSSTMSTTQPHFVVVTRNGTTLTMYIDGSSAAAIAGPALSISASDQYWGKDPLGMTQHLRGRISDMFCCTTTALTYTDVFELWVAGLGYHGETPRKRIGRTLDLIGWPWGLRSLDVDEIGSFPASPNLVPDREDRSALEAIQEAVECGDGDLFIDGDGNVCWRDQYSLPASTRSTIASYLPTGFWPLDEVSGTTARDLHASLMPNPSDFIGAFFGWVDVNGTYQGSPSLNQPGLLGTPDPGVPDRSVNFAAASSQYVSIPDAAQLEGGAAFFVGAWVRPSDFATERPIIAKSDGSASDWWLSIGTDGKLKFGFVNSGGTTRESITAAAMTAGQTYFVCGWFGSGVCFARWYAKDGTTSTGPNGAVAGGQTVRDTTKQVWIGRRHGAYMNGRISNVFFANAVRLSVGAVDHMFDGMWRAGYADATTLAPYAFADWAFEEQRITNRVRVEFPSSQWVADFSQRLVTFVDLADSTSIAAYGERALTETVPIESPEFVAGAVAIRQLAKTATPRLRAINCVLQGDLDPGLWPTILSLRLGARPTVSYRTWAGNTVQSTGYVSRIEHRMGRSGWDTSVQLSAY